MGKYCGERQNQIGQHIQEKQEGSQQQVQEKQEGPQQQQVQERECYTDDVIDKFLQEVRRKNSRRHHHRHRSNKKSVIKFSNRSRCPIKSMNPWAPWQTGMEPFDLLLLPATINKTNC